VSTIDLLDVLLLILLLAALLNGYRQGGLALAAGVIGAIVGAVLAVFVLPQLAGYLPPFDRDVRSVVMLGIVLTALLLGQAVGSGLVGGISRRIEAGPFRLIDKLLGMVIGAAEVILVVWFLAPVLAVGPFPRVAEQIQASRIVAVIHRDLPPPGPVIGRLRALVDPLGFPQVFQLFEAPPAEPVPSPRSTTVAALGKRVAGATVEVLGEACGMELTGTGFAVAPDYVITNAHVVAGERGTTRVVTTAGKSLKATVVRFEPNLDVALLHVTGAALPVLSLSSEDPTRGATGIAVGHPRGGGLALIPAAVRDVFDATGYDIYGSAPTTRTVVELAANVESGDSGGPFVGTDGRVLGVVFARSRTDPGIGYALLASEVRRVIDAAMGRIKAVGTGACVP